MLTVCPKCTLTLAVTAADLRAGQGYVRCGRCANVFNALLGLTEESAPGDAQRSDADLTTASATASRPMLTMPEPAATAPPPQPAAPEPAPAPAAPAAAAAPAAPAAPAAAAAPARRAEAPPRPAAAPALRLVESAPRPAPRPLPVETADTADMDDTDDTTDEDVTVEEIAVGDFRGTDTFETIVLEGDTYLQTEESIPEEVLNSELADVSRRIASARDNTDSRRPELARELVALREATGEFRHEANLMAPDAGAKLLQRPRRARPGWLEITAAALLALALAAQVLNHWRDDLAAHAAWYGPVSRVAALLGEPLHPNWNLSAYDVRQLGAAADGTDNRALRVRLSLANVGDRTQALPLLRVTLLDRYGKAVGSGALEPPQYLPAGLREQRFLAPDQRIDTEVRVLDPTQQASSFELDVCIGAAGGGLRCAGDATLVAAAP